MKTKLIFLAELAVLFGLYLILLYETLAWVRNFLAFWMEVGKRLGWIAVALPVSLPGDLEGGAERALAFFLVVASIVGCIYLATLGGILLSVYRTGELVIKADGWMLTESLLLLWASAYLAFVAIYYGCGIASQIRRRKEVASQYGETKKAATEED